MRKFNLLASMNCRNIVLGSNRYVHSGMRTIDTIMALKDHFAFRFVQDNRFPGQLKDIIFVLKILVDLFESGVELVKCM